MAAKGCKTAECVRCHVSKALWAFDSDSSRPNGKYPWCKLCRKKYSPKSQQSVEDDPNGHDCPLCDTPIRGHANRRFCSSYCKERVAGLRKKFGLTVKQYRALIAATGGRCPICACRPKKWAVDHDHQTGAVMGAVCTGCNVGLLAHSKHRVDLALNLANFLEESPASQIGINVIVPEDPDGKIRGKSQVHKMWGR